MAITTAGGIVLSLNGQDVTLSPSSTGDLKKTGAEYTLPEPIAIGSAKDISAFLSDTFGAPALPAASTFPSPLDQVYGKLTDLVLTVDEFSLKVPPTQNADGSDIPPATRKATSFTVGISAMWPPGQEVNLITGKLAVKGIYLSVSKDDTP